MSRSASASLRAKKKKAFGAKVSASAKHRHAAVRVEGLAARIRGIIQGGEAAIFVSRRGAESAEDVALRLCALGVSARKKKKACGAGALPQPNLATPPFVWRAWPLGYAVLFKAAKPLFWSRAEAQRARRM